MVVFHFCVCKLCTLSKWFRKLRNWDYLSCSSNVNVVSLGAFLESVISVKNEAMTWRLRKSEAILHAIRGGSVSNLLGQRYRGSGFELNVLYLWLLDI